MVELFCNYAREAKEARQTRYSSRGVILFRLDMIGDCTMFSSTLRSIREFYGDREFTVLCTARSAPVFQRLGVCEVYPIDLNLLSPDMEKLETILSDLRQKEYDILLQPQVSKCPISDLLAAAIKCNRRIQIEPYDGREARGANCLRDWVYLTNPLYDEIIPFPRQQVSEFDIQGAFARGIGIHDFKTRRPNLPVKKQNWVQGEYYVLCPGGSFYQKYWSPKRFAALADYVYEKTHLTGVILATAKERWVAEKIKQFMKPETAETLVDLTGQTKVEDMIDVIGNARLCIANDSGGAHVACATNVPCVATVGAWFLGRFLPYHIEEILPGDHIPLVAYVDLPCKRCGLDYNYMFEHNPKCLRRFFTSRTADCIDSIPLERMKEYVDQVL